MKHILLLLFLFGCVSKNDKSEQKAIFVMETVWDKRDLTVCWLTPGFDFYKTMIRNFITEEFHLKTTLRFLGWKKCKTASPSDIRIELVNNVILDGHLPSNLPGQSNIGKGLSDQTWLYHENRPGKPTLQLKKILFGNGYNSTAYLVYAIHEFGHAIGFLHEDMNQGVNHACLSYLNRSGHASSNSRAHAEFQINKAGGSLTYFTSKWDSKSVMSYCNMYDAFKRLDVPRLSKFDVLAISKMYGAPPRSRAAPSSGSSTSVDPTERPNLFDLPFKDFDGKALSRIQKAMIKSGSYLFSCDYFDKFSGEYGVSIKHNTQRFCGTASDKIPSGSYTLPFIYSDVVNEIQKVRP